MTVVAVVRPKPLRTSAGETPFALAAMILGATALALLLAWPIVPFVLAGGFGDPDDAMRLAEVRAWMAGQSWFDVTALRLDPPVGASMHWSRLVDVPNAGLIRLFGLFVPSATAEALDRIVLPTLWLVLLYLGMARLANVLSGRRSRGAAILGTLLSGATLVQVQPGRIGHHAPETVLLVLAVGAALAGLAPGRQRQAALAGALVALALALSLETVPLLGALCLVMVMAWVSRGDEAAPALAWFGLGLGLGLPLIYVASVPLSRWLVPVADALGPGHLGAGLIGALGAVTLGVLSPRLPVRADRLAATGVVGLALVGLALVGFVLLAAPELLRSPFASVDPLVRAVWLDQVVESKPWSEILWRDPALALAVVAAVALGAASALVAARRLGGLAALRFGAIAFLCLVGLGLGLWQLRAFASVGPLAVCGGLYAVDKARAWAQRSGLGLVASFAPLAILPFTPTAWALVLPSGPSPAAGGPSCLAPAALAPLATLPAGRAVAPLQAGAHLIATTRLDPFAAPYHRNNDGNRFALDVWGAPPDLAAALLRGRGTTYVLVCPGEGDVAAIASRAPNGLAARLLAHDVPTFLVRLPVARTPYAVYRVAPAAF